MKRIMFWGMVLFLVAGGTAGFTLAQERANDPQYENGPRATEVISDRQEFQPAAAETGRIWTQLEQMSPDEKDNAVIEIILDRNASVDARALADKIRETWNAGDYDKSAAMFSDLDNLTDPGEISIGASWRTPPVSKDVSWGGDVRIGDRDSIYVTALDIHRASGNLFAIVVYRIGASGSGWAVYHSTNDGLTWTETYNWTAVYRINCLSAAVVANHCYVVFSRGVDQDQVLVYRFNVSDGIRDDFDGGSSYSTAFTTTAPEAINEIDIFSNQDLGYPSYHRLYVVVITSSNNLKLYWDDEVATSWEEFATGVTNADRGLDICMNAGYSDYWMFASYIDTDDNLNIDGCNGLTWDNTFRQSVGSVARRYTAIGAYHDTVHCFYEYTGSATFYVRYQVSYSGGASYLWGTVDDTVMAGSECPAVAARHGGGVAAIYRYYTNPRQGRLVWRNYGGWPWPSNQTYTDHPPYYNRPSIEYLGDGTYGIVYTCWNDPYIQAAYFDRGSACCDVPGDANNDGIVNVGDPVFLINYVFKSGTPPDCLSEGDANCDGIVNVGDVVYLVNFVFKSGLFPCCI